MSARRKRVILTEEIQFNHKPAKMLLTEKKKGVSQNGQTLSIIGICSYCVLDRPVFERCQTLLHPELTPWWSFLLADGAHHKKPHSPPQPPPPPPPPPCYRADTGCQIDVLEKHKCIVMRIDEDSSAYSESFKRVECTNWAYHRVTVTLSGPSTTHPLFAVYVWYYIMAGHAIVVVKDITLLFYHGNAVILAL